MVISTIREKLKRCSLTTVIPVVFLFVGIIAHAAFAHVVSGGELVRRGGVIGGPSAALAESAHTAVESEPSIAFEEGAPEEEPQFTVSRAALLEAGPSAGALPGRDGLMVYRVERGDTLSGIAASFGISLQTILDANPGVRTKALQVGQELVVLPISGVTHAVRTGDTLSSVGSLYRVAPEEIARANKGKIAGNELLVGEIIVIPGATVKGSGYMVGSALQSLPGYFAPPAAGYNWGKIHENNAVDIANPCGTPIYAAAEGLVTVAEKTGWNDGYGAYLYIEHPNGTGTLYAHLSEVDVSLGDYVQKKDQIALMGNTGNVHGPTGCHLHFEVHGAKNPLAK